MIKYQQSLIEGRFIRRYKRFFADIDTSDGMITAHCPNTGRMTGLLDEGSRVWFRQQPPARKLGFAWELVETSLGMACINTARANELLSLTDLSRWIPEVTFVRREPTLGSHRLDLELARGSRPVYVEIKSVTMCGDRGVGLFPDAPSERATQHVNLLADIAADGIEAHLIFVAMHTGIQSVSPYRKLDGAFADACQRARDLGVAVHALETEITPQCIQLAGVLPVPLD